MKRQIKNVLTSTVFLFTVATVLIITTGCLSDIAEEEKEGITTMTEKSEHLSYAAIEETHSEEAFVEITLDSIPESIENERIDRVYILSDEVVHETGKKKTIGGFYAWSGSEGVKAGEKTTITPHTADGINWGEAIAPELLFVQVDPETGEEIELYRSIDKQIKFNLSTWFLSIRKEVNREYEMFPEPNQEKVVYGDTTLWWSHDMFYIYVVRIPEGEYIDIGTELIITAIPHRWDWVGETLSRVHYRHRDYNNRFAMYEPPDDEPQKHIDPETEKWIQGPVRLTEGVYRLYICPSHVYDMSRLVVKSADSRGHQYKHTVKYTISAEWDREGGWPRYD